MKSLVAPLLNRAPDEKTGKFLLPEDGWYHLIPKGEFTHSETGYMQVIDDVSLASIVNRFQEDAAKPGFGGLLIDQEHWSYDPDKSSEALGWIKGMQNREDGIWGNIKWTDLGEQAVTAGRYRLRSPTWLAKDVEHLGNKRIRPLRLDSVGLTNNPNLKGLPALSNRGPSNDVPPDKKTSNTNMKSLLGALGLSGDASEESALAALNALKNRATQAEQANEPLKTENTQLKDQNKVLKNRNEVLLGQIVEQDLAKYANRFKPETKDTWKAQLIGNRDVAIQLLESLPEPSAEKKEETKTTGPIHNRNNTKTPEKSPTEAAQDTKEEARARAISNRAKAISKRDAVPYSRAWAAAEAEIDGGVTE